MNNQLPENQSGQVYPFLIRKSIESQREQINNMEIILNRMEEIEKNVTETSVEIKILAKQITDENRLLPAEIDELYISVVEKSISLAKARNKEEDEGFSKVVGKYRKLVWSKVKKRYGISKYIHLRRVDFKDALSFVSVFNPEDYL